MPSVGSACTLRVSGVGPARSAHGWRPSGVYILELRAQFCACTKIPTPTTNDDERIALVQRARRTISVGLSQTVCHLNRIIVIVYIFAAQRS